MGRAAIGLAAKTEVISGRVTKAQHEHLVRKYGSANKAVQAMVAKELKEEGK